MNTSTDDKLTQLGSTQDAGGDETVVKSEVVEMSSSGEEEEEEDDDDEPINGQSFSNTPRILNVTGYSFSEPDGAPFNGSSKGHDDREFPASRLEIHKNKAATDEIVSSRETIQNSNGGENSQVWKPTMSLLDLAYKLKKAEMRVFGRQATLESAGPDSWQSRGYARHVGDEDSDSITGETQIEYHSQMFGNGTFDGEDDARYTSYIKNRNNFTPDLSVDGIQNVKSEMMEQAYDDGSDYEQSYNMNSSYEPHSTSLFEMPQRTEYVVKRRHQCRLCPYSTDRQGHLKRHELAIHCHGGRKLKYRSPTSQNNPDMNALEMPSPVQELFSTPMKSTTSGTGGGKAIKISTIVASAGISTAVTTKEMRAAEVALGTTRTPEVPGISMEGDTPCSAGNGVVRIITAMPDSASSLATNSHADIPDDAAARIFCNDAIAPDVAAKMLDAASSDMAADPRRHRCGMCAYRTDCLSHLKRHTASVHNAEKIFRCNICPDRIEFARSDKLKKHYGVHHPGVPCNLHELRIVKKPTKPVPPPSSSQSRLPVPPPPSNKRPGDTDPDGVSFDDASADAEVAELVKISIETKVKGAKPFRCPKCVYTAKDVWHMRRHIGDRHVRCRHYRCRVCRYGTGRIDRLLAHQRTHGEMFCLYCESYSTAHADSYKRHMISCASSRTGWTWEGSNDPFGGGSGTAEEGSEQERTCRLCNVVYDSVSELEQHIDSAHIIASPTDSEFNAEAAGGRLLTCGTCGYQTKDSADMYVHVNSHAPQSFKCDAPDCDFKSTYAKTLELHHKYYHDASYEPSQSNRSTRNKLTGAQVAAAVAAAIGGFNPDGSLRQSIGTGKSDGDASFGDNNLDYVKEAGGFSDGMDLSPGYHSGGISPQVRGYFGDQYSKTGGQSSAKREGIPGTSMPTASVATPAKSAGVSTTASVGVYHSGIPTGSISGSKRDMALTNPKPTAASFPQGSSVQLLDINTADLPASGIFKCPICVDRAPFKYRRSFEKHLTQHASSVNLCPLCTDTFHSAADLQQHVLVAHSSVQYNSAFLDNIGKSPAAKY